MATMNTRKHDPAPVVVAEVWPDPEKRPHGELARLVADIQDVFADGDSDPVAMIEWLLTEAGLWKRETMMSESESESAGIKPAERVETVSHKEIEEDMRRSEVPPPPAATHKHTPGPWRAERIGGDAGPREKGRAFRIVAPEVGNIRDADIATVCYKPHFEDAEGNARLIAAAPELAEALRKAMGWINKLGVSSLPAGSFLILNPFKDEANALLAEIDGTGKGRG